MHDTEHFILIYVFLEDPDDSETTAENTKADSPEGCRYGKRKRDHSAHDVAVPLPHDTHDGGRPSAEGMPKSPGNPEFQQMYCNTAPKVEEDPNSKASRVTLPLDVEGPQ